MRRNKLNVKTVAALVSLVRCRRKSLAGWTACMEKRAISILPSPSWEPNHSLRSRPHGSIKSRRYDCHRIDTMRNSFSLWGDSLRRDPDLPSRFQNQTPNHRRYHHMGTFRKNGRSGLCRFCYQENPAIQECGLHTWSQPHHHDWDEYIDAEFDDGSGSYLYLLWCDCRWFVLIVHKPSCRHYTRRIKKDAAVRQLLIAKKLS